MKLPVRLDSLELVRNALAGLRFGEVVIAVHDGEIVQIDRTEKLRPQRGPERASEHGPERASARGPERASERD